MKLEPKRITNKFDLMRYNTPSFASTVVTWDISKLTPLTFKRVLNALQTGGIKYQNGDASSRYHALRKQFEIPHFTLTEPKVHADGKTHQSGYIHWEFATDELLEALDPVYQAERVVRRLEAANGNGWISWCLYDEKISPDRNYFYYETKHDVSKVKQAIENIMASPEVASKRRDAINFLQDGGKLEFTWRVDGNRSE